jgi:hypothetical protein
MPNSPSSDCVSDEQLLLITTSYRRLTGKPLLDAAPSDNDALRKALWEAPRAIVAHGTETDPVFFYGNRLALQLFEMNFGDFTRLPSRYSAEPLAREARAQLLERVTRYGYVDDYAGVRISGKGRRFRIEAATVWNLVDETGICRGQAATFSDWRPV